MWGVPVDERSGVNHIPTFPNPTLSKNMGLDPSLAPQALQPCPFVYNSDDDFCCPRLCSQNCPNVVEMLLLPLLGYGLPPKAPSPLFQHAPTVVVGGSVYGLRLSAHRRTASIVSQRCALWKSAFRSPIPSAPLL